jgi:hypothetical protein
MLDTPVGIVMLLKPVRLLNASLAMLLTLYVTPPITKEGNNVTASEREVVVELTVATPEPLVYVYITVLLYVNDCVVEASE